MSFKVESKWQASLWWPASSLKVAPSSSWYPASLSLAPLSALSWKQYSRVLELDQRPYGSADVTLEIRSSASTNLDVTWPHAVEMEDPWRTHLWIPPREVLDFYNINLLYTYYWFGLGTKYMSLGEKMKCTVYAVGILYSVTWPGDYLPSADVALPLQFPSSELSPQSFCPSQIHLDPIQRRLSHWNKSGPHE